MTITASKLLTNKPKGGVIQTMADYHIFPLDMHCFFQFLLIAEWYNHVPHPPPHHIVTVCLLRSLVKPFNGYVGTVALTVIIILFTQIFTEDTSGTGRTFQITCSVC